MSLVAIFLIASVLSLSYRKGETFSYQYESTVTTGANQVGVEGQDSIHHIAARATFKVLQLGAEGAYLSMTLSDVESSVGNSAESEAGQHDEDSEMSYAVPIYFQHLADGTIKDVVATVDDDEDNVNLKTSVLFSLQTSLTTGSGKQYEQASMIDPQGSHYEYFQSTLDGEKIIINSHYSQEDFMAFADEETDSAELTLDTNSIREIVGGRITKSHGTVTIGMNKRMAMTNEDEEAPIDLITVGTSTLADFAQGNDEEIDFPYTSFEAFINERPQLRRVPQLDPTWYLSRRPRTERPVVSDELDGFKGCPGDIDFCRGFDQSWTVGNSNIGLKVYASANAGVKKGCNTAIRSYAVGATAGLDVLILGKTISAAAGWIEYGQVNGSPIRNGMELKLFGQVFYSKAFPFLDCIDRDIPLASFSKDFSFSWSILVYVVQLKFTVGMTFGFTARLHYTICPMQLKASATLIPTGTATLHGGASASVAVAKAGIEIRGQTSDYLDPTAYVDGNICRVGFYMYNNVNPSDASLVGWWQTRTIKWHGFKTRITWGSKHEHTFWHHSWGGSRQKILDVFYGAK